MGERGSMNEQRVRAIVREELGLTESHVHDLRWAYLPHTSVYPSTTATVRCIASNCPWTAHQYVTIETEQDLPKYRGPLRSSWGPVAGSEGDPVTTDNDGSPSESGDA